MSHDFKELLSLAFEGYVTPLYFILMLFIVLDVAIGFIMWILEIGE